MAPAPVVLCKDSPQFLSLLSLPVLWSTRVCQSLRNLSGSDHTSPKWLSVHTSHLMRWVVHHPRCDGLVGFSQGTPFVWTGEGISSLACIGSTGACLNSAGLWPENLHVLSSQGEAGAAGLGTTLQDPSCGVVYLENPWDKVVMTPWLLLPEGQSWEDGGPDSYRLVGRILRSWSERPFRQNFPTVGRTRNTFLDSYFLINAVCFLKHFMTFLCKEYFLQLSVVFCFWCFSQTSVERTYWLWWLLFLVLFTLKSLCFSPSVTCVLELYDCSLSHAFVFSKLFYLHHLYNGTLLSVTETVVCLSQCGGLRGAVCWRLYCFRAMWVLFCTWDLHHQGSNPYIGSSES